MDLFVVSTVRDSPANKDSQRRPIRIHIGNRCLLKLSVRNTKHLTEQLVAHLAILAMEGRPTNER